MSRNLVCSAYSTIATEHWSFCLKMSTKVIEGFRRTQERRKMPPSNPKRLMDDYYEGERLNRLLQSLQREIESARLADGNTLPEKIWFKQQFAIGVNEVSRALENMTNAKHTLQVVVVASDCNPKWLTKHLASKVPFIFVRDEKRASLRLGQLLNLKTAIAIGIKDKGNSINQFFSEILRADLDSDSDSDCPNSQLLST